MTGEMTRGDVTRDSYPIHFAIADRLGGTVEPFDQYQGPYVLVGPDVRSGCEPYQIAPRGLGIVRLWVIWDDDNYGLCTIFNEVNECVSLPFFWDDVDGAVIAALSIMESTDG